MIAVVRSASLCGSAGYPVVVEVHISRGLPGFTIVGLPDTAVREARDRVRAALLSSGLPWPRERVTVNLAPSGLRKAGAGLDLPIAVGVLAAQQLVPLEAVAGLAFVGELGLDGSVRHVPDTVALAGAVEAALLVVPAVDAVEAAVGRSGQTVGVGSLTELVAAVRGTARWPAPVRAAGPPERAPIAELADVRGQPVGRRAVEVAAAGGHHLLLVGPPGSGKTMLATRLVGLLPRLSRAEAVEVSRTHSAAGVGLPPGGLVWDPPFRAPHHGASAVSLVGGGTWAMRPGEISLADHGVLFLDEMGEFPAAVLDALRQPLEEGVIRVSRARGSVEYPARFLLVGAMNPCPCGSSGVPGACRCSPAARARTVRRLSGPLLDRFDLVVAVRPPAAQELLSPTVAEPTAVVRARVAAARRLAGGRGAATNAALSSGQLEVHAPLSADAARMLEDRVAQGLLSGRGLARVRRVARTIADLDGGAGVVGEEHVAEALALRAGREILDAQPELTGGRL